MSIITCKHFDKKIFFRDAFVILNRKFVY